MPDVNQQGGNEAGEDSEQIRQGVEKSRVAVKEILNATSTHDHMTADDNGVVMWGVNPKITAIFSNVLPAFAIPRRRRKVV